MDYEHQVVVVVVPLPAQGHLNQLIHFSRLVSDRQIPVHYVGAATHNRQIKDRVHGWDPSATSNIIHFHDFSIPAFATPPPDTNASNKWPSHLMPVFEATVHLQEPLGELLRSLSLTSRRVVVVHDNVMSFVAKEATLIPNGEAYSFNSCSAFGVMFFKWEALGRPSFPGIESLSKELLELSYADCMTFDFINFVTKHMEYSDLHVGEIYNTCYPIEGKFIDLVSQEPFLKASNKQWAFGPLNPISVNSKSDHKCLDWLDKQSPNSVLYVSFGTMTSISDEEIRAIAIGLEKSEQKFIWVLRQADLGDVYANQDDQEIQIKLPEGYEERVKGVGMIVRDWAPQLEILAHSSTGGFLTHCGWNSCMESLSMGVPMAAWPMHSDQPRNTMLITEILKVGVVAKAWGNKEEVASPSLIEHAVRKLMVSNDGKDIRKRAEELGVSIRESASKDGKSTAEFNSFIAHISRETRA